MFYLFIKAAITGTVVVAITELAKRSSLLAAVLASLPLTSILAFVWMYSDSKNVDAIKNLSYGIFWMVLPSLVFFLLLPLLLKFGFRFYPALLVSCACMAVIYVGYTRILGHFGVQI